MHSPPAGLTNLPLPTTRYCIGPESRSATLILLSEHLLEHLMQIYLTTQPQIRLKSTKSGPTVRKSFQPTPKSSGIPKSKWIYCNQLTPLLTVFQLTLSQEQESLAALNDVSQRSTEQKTVATKVICPQWIPTTQYSIYNLKQKHVVSTNLHTKH